ncbi:MAG: hypothetical protein SVR94_09745 [Pseudomonadota bacterium]|nr:hypothetical protein [Pseudomonadota bacterium]
MRYYRRIATCGNYKAYTFELTGFEFEHYCALKTFIQTLGQNHYPQTVQVLRIQQRAFFIDFPAYGFPYFKISFYRQNPQTIIDQYLNLINDYLNQIKNNKC